MITFCSPYSLEKDFGKAYNEVCQQVQSDDDWICCHDLDVLFLKSDIGHQLDEIIKKYPNTGLFTCLTNRVGQVRQCYGNTISEDPNILNHKKIADRLASEKRLDVSPIKNPISGHLLLFKKSTWKSVGGFPEKRGILSVDNTFSNRIAKHNFPILLMEGVYVFHYYRMQSGRFDKSHLL